MDIRKFIPVRVVSFKFGEDHIKTLGDIKQIPANLKLAFVLSFLNN